MVNPKKNTTKLLQIQLTKLPQTRKSRIKKEKQTQLKDPIILPIRQQFKMKRNIKIIKMAFSNNYTLEFKISIEGTIHFGRICTNKKERQKGKNLAIEAEIKQN